MGEDFWGTDDPGERGVHSGGAPEVTDLRSQRTPDRVGLAAFSVALVGILVALSILLV